MSGGHFGCNTWVFDDIANSIEIAIQMNDIPNEWDIAHNFPEEVLDKFRETVTLLRKTSRQVHAIDYLLSGDIGPEQMLKRWEE